MPDARAVALTMHEIEESVDELCGTPEGEPTPIDAVIRKLLNLDGDVEAVLMEEVNRAIKLSREHYGRVAILNDQRAGLIGFVQGVTFAAAARRLSNREKGTNP